MNYSARNEHKPFARLTAEQVAAKYKGRRNHRHEMSKAVHPSEIKRQGPNVRIRSTDSVSVQMHKGGAIRLVHGVRTGGHYIRLRDGACVSHKLA